MTDSNSSPDNKRQHPRFLCIGIELLYSPVGKNILNDVAQSLQQATCHDISLAGMAFDIEHELPVNEQLMVSVKSPDGGEEILKTQVRWCRAIDDTHYRVGVTITEVIKPAEMQTLDFKLDKLDSSDGVPNQVRLSRPACNKEGWFTLVGTQEGVPYPTLLPLYNCSHCNTTRSIPSLLSFNRQLSSED